MKKSCSHVSLSQKIIHPLTSAALGRPSNLTEKKVITNGFALCYQGAKPLIVFRGYSGQPAIGRFMETNMVVLFFLNEV